MARRKVATAFIMGTALSVTAAGCAVGGHAAARPGPAPTTSTTASASTTAGGAVSDVAPVKLVAYHSCSQFLDDVKREALAEVGPYGLGRMAGVTANSMAAVAT